MADTRYLRRRHETWFFALAVPRDLRAKLGTTRIVMSLKTRDLAEAQEQRWGLRASYTAMFRRVRNREPLSPAQIASLAGEVYTTTLERLEADAQRGKPVWGAPENDDDQRDPEVIGLDRAADQIALALEAGDYSVAAKDIAAMEKKIGFKPQPDSEMFNALAKAILDAQHSALLGRMAALEGQPSKPFHPPGEIDPVTLQPKATARGGLIFADAAARFIAERQRDPAHALTQQTKGQYEAAFRLFDRWAKQPKLDAVDRRKASDFLDAIASLNPAWGRGAGVKNKSFAEIEQRYGGHKPGLSAKTINRYAMALSMVWHFAEDRDGFEGKNPWQGQMRPTSKRRGNSELDKRAFRSDEIAKLLSHAPEVAPSKHSTPTTLPWLTLIGAYSGMRLNEICELRTDHVKETGGIWFFDLTRSKTEAGVRVVPVHSQILAAGLLDYLAYSSAGPLWPGLKPGGPDAKRSWYVSKRFTDYRRGLGLIDLDNVTRRDRLDFHSLRRAAVTALKHAGVPERDVAEIVGHDHPRVTFGVYPDRQQLGRLQAIVEAIHYRPR